MGNGLADINSDVDQHLASQPPPASDALADGGGVQAGSAEAGGSGGSASSPPAASPPVSETASTTSSAPAADLGVSSNWWKGMSESVTQLVNPPPPQPNAQTGRMPTQAQQAVAAARRVQSVVGNALGAIGMVGDAINAGFANLTNSIAKALPAFPAATIGAPYLGLPHTHNHPPSLVPPAPPVPLPSIGAVTLGTSVKVLINSMPAARCGDIGLAPTCGGLTPFFQIKTGSSNTFIGGNRAARALDICQACASADKREKGIDAGKVMGAIGATARGIQTAQKAMGYAAITMDAAEAAVEDDAAMQSAKARAAAMGAAQMAADAAAEALTKTMGKDPAGVPPKVIGAIMMGHPNVLIGGFPMVNIPNPAELLLKRLARYKRASEPSNNGCGREGEPVDVVTGANVDDMTDYSPIPGALFHWRRYYDSRATGRVGPMGRGFRHEYERELHFDLDGVSYVGVTGAEIRFAPPEADGDSAAYEGLVLRRVSSTHYEVEEHNGPRWEFAKVRDPHRFRVERVTQGSRSLALRYDDAGRLVGLSEGSVAIRVQYDEGGRIVALWRATGHSNERIAAYRYDMNGSLSRWTDALGNHASYRYDDRHCMTRKEDRRGYAFNYEYDAEGRCVHTFGDDGLYDVQFTYRPAERTTVVSFSDGGEWVYVYDDAGTITRIIDPYGGAVERLVDGDGHVVEEVDPGGTATSLLYTDTGAHYARLHPLGVLQPPRSVEPHPPNPLRPRLPATPLEREWGRAPLGLSGPRVELPGDLARRFGPEFSGGSVPEPPRTETDRMGKVVRRAGPRGAVREWRRDAEGNVVASTDASGAVRACEIGSWNLRRRIIDPLGHALSFEYSAREKVTRVVDEADNETRYVYDLKDRLVEVWRSGSLRESYAYDIADNLVEKRDGAGRILLRFDVGPANLKASRILPTGESQTFAYDSRGRCIGATSSGGAVELAYDPSGWRTRDLRDGRGLEREVAAGRSAVTRMFEQYVITQRWIGTGETRVVDPTGATHHVWFVRDSIVRRLANGTSELVRYDEAGRCLLKAIVRAGEGTRRERRYSYSLSGDLVEARDDESGVTRYEYDAAHRLVELRTPGGDRQTFAYDRAGNLVRQPGLDSVVMLPGNRLGAANGSRFEYDDRHQIASRVGADGAMRFEYDALDMLTRCEVDGRPWTATYDALRRRVRKSWNGGDTEFFWDGDRLAAEVNAGGRLRIYVYAEALSFVPMLFVDYDAVDAAPESGRRYYIFTDQVGAPFRVEDDDARPVWQARMDPYGAVHVAREAEVQIPLRFPGHYHDRETGLFYNRYRYYSPELGRYLQSDPMGLAGGYNVYAYPANPLTSVDLQGRHPDQPDRNQNDGDDDAESAPRPSDFDDEEVTKPGIQQLTESANDGSILLIGESEFRDAVKADLERIGATPSGQRLLEDIRNNHQANGTEISIGMGPASNPTSGRSTDANVQADGSPGTPSGSHVSYTPQNMDPDANMSPDTTTDTVLFHEMTHGERAQRGAGESGRPPRDPGFDADREEEATIARENEYREDRGQAPRTSHKVSP